MKGTKHIVVWLGLAIILAIATWMYLLIESGRWFDTPFLGKAFHLLGFWLSIYLSTLLVIVVLRSWITRILGPEQEWSILLGRVSFLLLVLVGLSLVFLFLMWPGETIWSHLFQGMRISYAFKGTVLAVFGLAAGLAIIVAVLSILHHLLRSSRSKKLWYYVLVSIALVTAVSTLGRGIAESNPVAKQWFRFLVHVRGERVPKGSPLVEFQIRRVSDDSFIKILSFIDRNHPAILVLLNVPKEILEGDNSVFRTIKNSKLVMVPPALSLDFVKGRYKEAVWGHATAYPEDFPFLYRHEEDLGAQVASIAAEVGMVPGKRNGAQPHGTMLINYYGVKGWKQPFPHFSAHKETDSLWSVLYQGPNWDVRHFYLDPRTRDVVAQELAPGNDIMVGESQEVARILEILTNKIIVVSLSDLSEFFTGTPRTRVSATIAQNLIDEDFLVSASRETRFVIQACLIVVLGLVFFRLSVWHSIAVILFLLISLIALLILLFVEFQVFIEPNGVILAFVLPVVFFTPYEIISERRRFLEEQIRLSQELRAAHDMQMGLMPTADPQIKGFEVSGLCRPAEEVGGDYFDYVWLDEKKTKLGIAIADVSGKAMKAAMTAVMTSGMVYREIGSNETPKSILQKINKPLYLKMDRGMFTAMLFAVIDTKTKKLRFSNAGQMPPLLVRNGQVKHLKVEGVRLPLGIEEEVEYEEGREQLKRGDVLLLYTDGIVEAMDEKGELYGFERLETAVGREQRAEGARQMVEQLFSDVQTFSRSAKQHDDMTVVVIRVTS